jgi:hypothetical protein
VTAALATAWATRCPFCGERFLCAQHAQWIHCPDFRCPQRDAFTPTTFLVERCARDGAHATLMKRAGIREIGTGSMFPTWAVLIAGAELDWVQGPGTHSSGRVAHPEHWNALYKLADRSVDIQRALLVADEMTPSAFGVERSGAVVLVQAAYVDPSEWEKFAESAQVLREVRT